MTDITVNNRHFENVVQDPIRFKIKLNIGEEVYAALRAKQHLLDAVDAANGAMTGYKIANSAAAASIFFAPKGFLAAIGVVSAATPLGWAIAAGTVGAGLSVIVGKRFVRGGSDQVKRVPDFINTPLDVLASGLFDMMASLSIKLADVDGSISSEERLVMQGYFIKEWGYDSGFVEFTLREIEAVSDEITIKQIATQLAEFKKANPDCNYKEMSKEMMEFLNELSEADGFIDEREEMALERIQNVFDDVGKFSIKEVAVKGASAIGQGVGAIGGGSKKAAEKIVGGASKSVKRLKGTLDKDKKSE